MGKEEKVVPILELHNSVCPRLCPVLTRAEPPGVRRMGPLGAQRVGLTDLL